MERRDLLSRRLAAVGVGLGIGALGVFALLWWGRLGPFSPWVATIVGMHDLDPEIGYVPKPGASLRHTHDSFDVVYEIGADGYRRVPGAEPDRAEILLLGDSWTFGHGVAGEETYAARMQERLPSHAVRNLGVMGYGTPHALLTLERALEDCGEVRIVVYGWTSVHVARSYLRASHISQAAGGKTPRFEQVDGRWSHVGLAGRDDAIEEDFGFGLRAAEWARTVGLIERMRDAAAAHGASFLVAILPGIPSIPLFSTDAARLAAELDAASIRVVDLERDPPLPLSDSLFLEGDGHPGPDWHRAVGDAIADRLDPSGAHR